MQLVIERLKYNFPEVPVYILTTDSHADDNLVETLKDYPVMIFRGSEHDVLERFVKAAIQFGVNDMIRICADNPFLMPEFIKELVDYDFSGLDYLSFAFRDKPVIKCHFGLFAERVSLAALKKVSAITKDRLYHEHVTNYIYEHPQEFSIQFIDKTGELAGLENFRLTVDTRADFENATTVLENIPDKLSPATSDLVKIKEKNPAFMSSMLNEIKNNSK